MNAVIAQSNVSKNVVNQNTLRSISSQSPSVKLSNQVAHPAHNRKGNNPGSGKNRNSQELQMIGHVMAASQQARIQARRDRLRDRVITPFTANPEVSGTLVPKKTVKLVKKLPAILLSDDSPLLFAIDALDWNIVHGKNPKPGFTAAIQDLRAEMKKACSYYEPVPVSNMYAVGVNPEFRALADGHGILCASGTKGFAVLNGGLCKHCRIGCVESSLMSYEQVFAKQLVQINQDIESVLIH